MNEFTRKIITGNPQALMYAKSLLTDPMLTVKIGGATFPITLEVETCLQNGNAAVSEQLVVTNEGKKYITDNVAPGSWSWTLSGYISGVDPLEPSSFFKPTVQFLCDIIRKAFKNGVSAIYKDIDCCLYNNVVIEDLTLEHRSDCKNKRPFSMVLKQIEVLSSVDGILSRLESLSTAKEGSRDGNSAELGQTSSASVSLSTLGKLVYK